MAVAAGRHLAPSPLQDRRRRRRVAVRKPVRRQVTIVERPFGEPEIGAGQSDRRADLRRICGTGLRLVGGRVGPLRKALRPGKGRKQHRGHHAKRQNPGSAQRPCGLHQTHPVECVRTSRAQAGATRQRGGQPRGPPSAGPGRLAMAVTGGGGAGGGGPGSSSGDRWFRPGAEAARPVKAWVQGRRISASTPLASSLPSAKLAG